MFSVTLWTFFMLSPNAAILLNKYFAKSLAAYTIGLIAKYAAFNNDTRIPTVLAKPERTALSSILLRMLFKTREVISRICEVISLSLDAKSCALSVSDVKSLELNTPLQASFIRSLMAIIASYIFQKAPWLELPCSPKISFLPSRVFHRLRTSLRKFPPSANIPYSSFANSVQRFLASS